MSSFCFLASFRAIDAFKRFRRAKLWTKACWRIRRSPTSWRAQRNSSCAALIVVECVIYIFRRLSWINNIFFKLCGCALIRECRLVVVSSRNGCVCARQVFFCSHVFDCWNCLLLFFLFFGFVLDSIWPMKWRTTLAVCSSFEFFDVVICEIVHNNSFQIFIFFKNEIRLLGRRDSYDARLDWSCWSRWSRRVRSRRSQVSKFKNVFLLSSYS